MRIINRFATLILLSVSVIPSLGQSLYVDSLENLIKNHVPDTVKVWALNELSREYLYGDPDKSLNLVNEALQIARTIGYKRGEAYSYRVLATISATHDQYRSYAENMQKGIKLFIELKDSVGLANCYITEAVVHDRQLRFHQSIISYNKALAIFREAKMQDRIAVCVNNMGFVYYRMGKFEEAKKSLLEAVEINRATNNASVLMGSYGNLGLVYYQLGDFNEAHKYFDIVLSLHDELKGNSNTEAYVESIIGLSEIYKKEGNLDEQLKFLELARINSEKYQYLELLKETYLKLSEYHLASGNQKKAFESLQDFRVVDDSIKLQRTRNGAAIITSVINSAKLETDFENAQGNITKQELVIMQQEKTLIAVSLVGVLFFILLVLLYSINRGRRAMNRAMTTHRIAIDAKNRELEKLNQTKDKFFSVVAHDLRSPLNSLLGFSNLLVKHADSMTKEEIQKMGTQLQEAVESTLKMTENLIVWARSQMQEEQTKPQLVKVNAAIAETFKVFKETASKKEIQLDGRAVEEANVYVDKNHFLLILRNLINNAIKYTKVGGMIVVKAKEQNGETEIVIEDTGLGMDDDVIEKLFTLDGAVSQVGTSGERGTGLGLILCKDFVERNNGSLQVKSEKNRGSTFTIILPSSN